MNKNFYKSLYYLKKLVIEDYFNIFKEDFNENYDNSDSLTYFKLFLNDLLIFSDYSQYVEKINKYQHLFDYILKSAKSYIINIK